MLLAHVQQMGQRLLVGIFRVHPLIGKLLRRALPDLQRSGIDADEVEGGGLFLRDDGDVPLAIHQYLSAYHIRFGLDEIMGSVIGDVLCHFYNLVEP